MTRRRVEGSMERIYSKAPGDECVIEFASTAPEDRGQVGRVRIRSTNGSGAPAMSDVWWLRCPWCRELIEFAAARLHVEGGQIRIDGPVVCVKCESAYTVVAGVATKRRIEGAGHPAVTSEA
ncbi:MAG: hypothetical protein ACYS5V_01500 [Planctomycetota bacterium]|jgi:hypothetical protein